MSGIRQELAVRRPSSLNLGPSPGAIPRMPVRAGAARRGGRIAGWLLVAAVALGAGTRAAAQEAPPWLPHYDLDIRLDPDGHQAGRAAGEPGLGRQRGVAAAADPRRELG